MKFALEAGEPVSFQLLPPHFLNLFDGQILNFVDSHQELSFLVSNSSHQISDNSESDCLASGMFGALRTVLVRTDEGGQFAPCVAAEIGALPAGRTLEEGWNHLELLIEHLQLLIAHEVLLHANMMI
jgi:hypothetical protein